MPHSIKHHLNSLCQLLSQLDVASYRHPSKYLSNASIGGHTRHIIEIYECLVKGYNTGAVDYINRKRNLEIEHSPALALLKLNTLLAISELNNKELNLICETDSVTSTIKTSYYRELLYNVEHTIHHFALIKVILIELNLSLVDQNFGFAYSTIKYKKSLTTVNA